MLEPVEIRFERDHLFEKQAGSKKCAACGLYKNHIGHAGTPKSLNVGGSGQNRWVYQQMKKDWAHACTEKLAGRLQKGLDHVLVEGQMCFPDRIRRDQGNFRFMIEKALGDALKVGGWLEDDDWDRYEFGGLEKVYLKGESWTRLVIFPRASGAAGVEALGMVPLAGLAPPADAREVDN